MKTLVAVLLLATGSVSYGGAETACTGQIHPNPGFEQGTAGWTAGPRVVVLGDARTGRAHATFAGLDVTRSDLLRASVTVPAGCALTVRFWVRTTTTETTRGDHLNVGLAITGTPPKTMYSLAFDGSPQWRRYQIPAAAADAERTAIVSFAASESAGGGVTTFDLDDVTFRLS